MVPQGSGHINSPLARSLQSMLPPLGLQRMVSQPLIQVQTTWHVCTVLESISRRHGHVNRRPSPASDDVCVLPHVLCFLLQATTCPPTVVI